MCESRLQCIVCLLNVSVDIDIGNTNITIGTFDVDGLANTWRVSTDHARTSDEYAMQIVQILHSEDIDISKISCACICSVVPPLTPTFVDICERYLRTNPIVVGSGSKCLNGNFLQVFCHH